MRSMRLKSVESMTAEQKDKNGNWQNELRSPGINPNRENDLNDKSELADSIKLTYYSD